MSKHANFMVALAIAALISLLVSMLVLLPECMPGPWQEECVAAKRLSALVYGLTAAVLFALSIILHWKQSRVGSFVAIVSLMVLPFIAAAASR